MHNKQWDIVKQYNVQYAVSIQYPNVHVDHLHRIINTQAYECHALSATWNRYKKKVFVIQYNTGQ